MQRSQRKRESGVPLPGAQPGVRFACNAQFDAMSSRRPPQSASRGLATVAMLKVNFDLRRDHIGMFEPMLLDTVANLPTQDFSTDEIRSAISARHELLLPADTVRTLLGRITKRGFLRR